MESSTWATEGQDIVPQLLMDWALWRSHVIKWHAPQCRPELVTHPKGQAQLFKLLGTHAYEDPAEHLTRIVGLGMRGKVPLAVFRGIDLPHAMGSSNGPLEHKSAITVSASWTLQARDVALIRKHTRTTLLSARPGCGTW